MAGFGNRCTENKLVSHLNQLTRRRSEGESKYRIPDNISFSQQNKVVEAFPVYFAVQWSESLTRQFTGQRENNDAAYFYSIQITD